MLTLITGGASSGKSDFAEWLVCRLPGERIYVATMEPFGKENLSRIARHREKRKNKGFITMECSTNIGSLVLPERANVLLEDLPNLLANEMFSASGGGGENLTEELLMLSARCASLTVVTGDLFSGGNHYEGDMLLYLQRLALCGNALAQKADLAVEVVCSVPNILKGRIP